MFFTDGFFLFFFYISYEEHSLCSELCSHQPISLSAVVQRDECSASAWEIERVKAPWTTFQARAITESREK